MTETSPFDKAKIHLLPDAIANQIAAGEVVQRPASVVKELLENAIDAGATEIKVIIKDAGKALIQVVDNGSGMNEIDARFCFERHATSKLRKSEDLFKITTKGFRGEALASIAAVAQVELKTKQHTSETGTGIQIEGSEIKSQKAVATSNGTNISVKNLFFNVPARRNFLKSNPVETRHIFDEFTRVSLAHPDVAFQMFQNDHEALNLSPGKLSQRIVGLFGKNYKEQLAACEEETEFLNVRGYIGKPELAKKSRGEQFFFVNQRFIKSGYLNHAVLQAYEELVPAKHFPFFALFLEIDPKHIDVNVHPTKTEIKFDDERTIYGILKSAVRQALAQHHFTPSLDFGHNINFNIPTKPSQMGNTTNAERDYASFKTQQSNQDWEKLYDGLKNSKHFEVGDQKEERLFTSKANDLTPQEIQEKFDQTGNKYIQLHQSYILGQVKQGLLIVHQAYAHQRILFEKYQRISQAGQAPSQQLLFPETLSFSPAEFGVLLEYKDEVAQLGFDFEIFGKSDLIIRGVPVDLKDQNFQKIFEDIIEQVSHFASEINVTKNEKLLRSWTKRIGTKIGQTLSVEESQSMVDQLFACKNASLSPSGKPTFHIFSLLSINAFFE